MNLESDLQALRASREDATRHFFRELLHTRAEERPLYVQAVTNHYFRTCTRLDQQIRILQQLQQLHLTVHSLDIACEW